MSRNTYQIRYEDQTSGNPRSQELTEADLSLEQAFGLTAELEADAFLTDFEDYGRNTDRSQGYTVTPSF